jgi:hypothetical protein
MAEKTNEMRVIECKDFDDFTAKIRALRWGIPRIFRGQRSVEWPLASVWERRLKSYRDGYHAPGTDPFWGEHRDRNLDDLFGPEGREVRNEYRDQFLEMFRELVRGLPGVDSEILKDEKQTWALGRHHGLVTPLLDWTRSPYVAIFFACFDYAEYHNPGWKSGIRGAGGFINFMGTSDKPAEPIAVWELALPENIELEGEFEIFTLRPDQAHRQKAQQGIFTMLTHSTSLDLVTYLNSRELAHYMTRYELPGQEVGRALWNLRLMNITYGTLFPDLEGAAIEANTNEALSVCKFHYPLQEDILEKEDAM